MKKILTSFLILLFTIQLVEGQRIDTSMGKSPLALQDMYRQKRNANNTAGWLMFFSAIGMMIGSMAINLSGGILGGGRLFSDPVLGRSASSNSNSNPSKGVWLAYVGGATTLASIPFFISAGSNKTKASLALKKEAITTGNRMVDKSHYAAIAFTIQL